MNLNSLYNYILCIISGYEQFRTSVRKNNLQEIKGHLESEGYKVDLQTIRVGGGTKALERLAKLPIPVEMTYVPVMLYLWHKERKYEWDGPEQDRPESKKRPDDSVEELYLRVQSDCLRLELSPTLGRSSYGIVKPDSKLTEKDLYLFNVFKRRYRFKNRNMERLSEWLGR